MKNQIIQRVLGTLLSTVLIMGIVACSLRFIPTSEPPRPKQRLIEAPFIPTPIWRVYQLFYVKIIEAIMRDIESKS